MSDGSPAGPPGAATGPATRRTTRLPYRSRQGKETT
ncbi:hypothetical protein FHS34_001206 [Streptomyces echinatus]|uniref:Uncharacterized protein n=1 Tax=Streptomyces echinatus TaxID=67293 RepID=A0A7W9PQW5_9ACTN|nr:hypothetical protein [Streptomyces echinatus]